MLLSLRDFGQLLGSTSVNDMAQKLKLERPLSVRDMLTLGIPLQPINLKIEWNQSGQLVSDYPNSNNVPAGLAFVALTCDDQGKGSQRAATSWEYHLQSRGTEKVFSGSPAVFVIPTSELAYSTAYTWRVVPLNEFGAGPSSPSFTFQTKAQAVPSPPHPPPLKPPTISVVYHPPPASAKFDVKGNGFTPNHVVHVRGVNSADVQHPAFANTTSDSSGAINMTADIPCAPGTQLNFSANDERPDSSDLTGPLWSNTVTITAS
jgi:hypothetical protein